MRALAVLAKTTVVAAEDTRVARRLLSAHNISGKHLVSLRAHNEQRAAAKLMMLIEKHGSAAYLSDAGTPGINDPGALLVRVARDAGVRVEPLPGASAVTTLISAAAAPPANCIFLGFPPRSQKQRQEFFRRLFYFHGSAILFEAPTRIADAVNQINDSLGGDTRLVLGRELTKLHEQIIDDKARNIANMLTTGEIPQRGEFSLLVETPGMSGINSVTLFTLLLQELPPRKAAAIAAKFDGADAKTLYAQHLSSLKNKQS